MGALSVLTDKNLKASGQQVVGLYLENCLQTYIDTKFFYCSVAGKSFLNLSKQF